MQTGPQNAASGLPLAAAGAILFAVSALAFASVYAATTVDVETGDPVHGRTVYQRCMGCHSLDENDLGPRHRGVVGRVAGAVPDYEYSAALKNSRIVWDRASLDRWLTDPQGMVPGVKMFFAVPDPQDRADVIAFLAKQR